MVDRAAWELEIQRRRQPKHRLKGCGNALVPQVAEWIGRRVVLARDASLDRSSTDHCALGSLLAGVARAGYLDA